jgi:hypothetical protein
MSLALQLSLRFSSPLEFLGLPATILTGSWVLMADLVGYDCLEASLPSLR